MSGLLYVERTPAPKFARLVLCSWSFVVARAADDRLLHDVWPDGCVSLLVVTTGHEVRAVTVTGPTLRPRRVVMRAGQSVHGLRCWPDAACSVLGVDPVQLREGAGDGSLLLGRAVAQRIAAASSDDARDAVWSRWLALRGVARDPPDAAVRRVVDRLIASDGAMPIIEASEDLGVGMRQLERRFRTATGMTPKEFARVRRVRAVIGRLLGGGCGWARLASEIGFADQAHLAREVRAITGLTPRGLLERLTAIEHDGVIV